MGLRRYREKRDFSRTPEPGGARADRARTDRTRGHSFVIHKHDASRLHYDLRLELDGVLKSWAVPRGPGLEPAERRLAVEVEDHPLDYGSFEGTIPKGEYGGGTVLLWDRGTWTPKGDARAGLRRGRLTFRLDGEKLRGTWSLVRMEDRANESGRRNWLLIRGRDGSENGSRTRAERSVATGRSMDEIARGAPSRARRSPTVKAAAKVPKVPKVARAPFPAHPKPELATLVQSAPVGDEWLHEIKYDGYRVLAACRGGRVRLLTRGGLDWTRRFGVIARALERLASRSALLDGEIVVVGEDGTTDFQALQNVLDRTAPGDLVYYAFDLLHLDGHDLTSLPLIERKRRLAGLLGRFDPAGPVRYSDHIEGGGPAVLEQACRLGLEGVVSKRRDAPYRAGRGRDWLKSKCAGRQEFVIAGFTAPQGARQSIGALLLGVYDDAKRLRYAGRVGTGFTNATLADLLQRLEPLETGDSPFDPPLERSLARGVRWVRPRLVAEVQFTAWTRDGRLRHPSFQGLRLDKKPRTIIRERAAGPSPKARVVRKTTRRAAPGARFTNPDKLLYPDIGVTKRELATYYESVADRALAHIAGRPLMVVRCPGGAGSECFYQKHAAANLPSAIGSVDVKEESGKIAHYLSIDDVRGLLALVQMDVLEIHVWGCRNDRIERPDRMVFDLDPAPHVRFEQVVRAARVVRERLEGLGLRSFVKTTGGRGLHVVVPLARVHTWDVVRAYSKAIAQSLAAGDPTTFTATLSKAKRRGAIFVDYLRNGRGATWVAPYSSRNRPGATVSTPVPWESLTARLQPERFTVLSLPRRVHREVLDPWRAMEGLRQTLSGAGSARLSGAARRR